MINARFTRLEGKVQLEQNDLWKVSSRNLDFRLLTIALIKRKIESCRVPGIIASVRVVSRRMPRGICSQLFPREISIPTGISERFFPPRERQVAAYGNTGSLFHSRISEWKLESLGFRSGNDRRSIKSLFDLFARSNIYSPVIRSTTRRSSPPPPP